MTIRKQVRILKKKGVEAWNLYRVEQRSRLIDLKEAKLNGMDLRGVNLSKSYLKEINLSDADLSNASFRYSKLLGANLKGANLQHAYLMEADLSEANLSGANLREANLKRANLSGANLYNADLTKANLQETILDRVSLVKTILRGANLSQSHIYGISTWNLITDQETKQQNLVITEKNKAIITVDNLEVAQFIHLLLKNEKIRDVIDTVGKKAVLILGRFTEGRIVILNALRDELRKHNYLPILFDFEKPASRDRTETVSALAHLARFIIVDLTEPKSVPAELATIVPTLSVPFQPLLLEGSKGEYALFRDLKKYDWVLSTHPYKNSVDLLESCRDKLIPRAEKKAKKLIARKH